MYYFNIKFITKNLYSISNILQIIYILFEQFIYYLYHNNRFMFIKYTTKKIENINIVYVKLFQIIANNNHLINDNEKNYLLQYTDNVKYNEKEIDYARLNILKTN